MNMTIGSESFKLNQKMKASFHDIIDDSQLLTTTINEKPNRKTAQKIDVIQKFSSTT